MRRRRRIRMMRRMRMMMRMMMILFMMMMVVVVMMRMMIMIMMMVDDHDGMVMGGCVGSVRSCARARGVGSMSVPARGVLRENKNPTLDVGKNIPKRFRQDKTVPRCPKVLWNQKTVPKDLWAPRSKPAVV